jgi:hypothetical protein
LYVDAATDSRNENDLENAMRWGFVLPMFSMGTMSLLSDWETTFDMHIVAVEPRKAVKIHGIRNDHERKALTE